MTNFVNNGLSFEEVKNLFRWVRHGDMIEYKTTHNKNCIIPKNKLIFYRYRNLVIQRVGVIKNYFLYGWVVDSKGEHEFLESNGAMRLTRAQGINMDKNLNLKNGELLVLHAYQKPGRKRILTHIQRESVYYETFVKRKKVKAIKSNSMKKLNKINMDSII